MRRTVLFTLICFLFVAFARAQAPTPAFSADSVSGCSPLVVTFIDASTGNPTSWYWEFGNGATSTRQNPSTTYFTPGKYKVTLKVTNLSGSNTLTKTEYITVYGTPEVSFMGSDSVGCYPFPVQFTDLSKASDGTKNIAWVWDMGDGSQTTVQNPLKTYMSSGNYAISLKVTNDKGCWSTITKQRYIKIDGGVKAGFSFVQPNACHTPFTIQFTNASTGPGALSYTWDFGDGATSTDASPTHTYTTAGMYSVTLITKSSNGCRDSLRKTNLLNLQNITTTFRAQDSACVGDAVSFNNLSSASAASSYWDFGDGTSSTLANPVKAFNAPGVYTAKLTQSYGACTDTFSKKIQVFQRPTAGFTGDKLSYCQPPLAVNFQNTSTDAVSYQWDFGDGSTSTDATPSHTYTTYGEYTVTLVATNAFGCTETLRMPGYIKIKKPSISINSLPIRECAPYTQTFRTTIDSPDPVVSYQWDFGNGTTSTEAEPTVTFTEPGSYTVRLAISTASGCSDTISVPDAVMVGKKPSANFSAVPNNVCAMQSVQFTNLSRDGNGWFWTFGDGGTSTDENPLHQYTDTGSFTVTLIGDNYGCKDTFYIQNYIKIKAPIARYWYTTTCDNKLFYKFTDRSLGAKTWLWEFGDGTTSTEQNPTHRFPAYGEYIIKLTVTNDTCFHFTRKRIVIVNGTPDFTASPSPVCQGTPTMFTADTTNSANIASYAWTFGDGSTGSGRITSFVYPKPGTYSISLTVTDINGCVDSVVKSRLVQINGPIANLNAINNNGCRGLRATFTDASKDDGKNKIIRWQWDLGDGTTVDTTKAATLKHSYPKAGSYDISLKVTDAGGCADTLFLPALVNTSDIQAEFASADTVSCPGASVRFTNLSKALTSYSSAWTFGNGTTSTQQNPVGIYSSDGQYSVKLKIWDAYGCTDSLTKASYVSIKHPVASFTISDSASSCIPLKVAFTNTSTYYVQYLWILNGGTSQLANPIQYYNQPGVFQAKLMVTSPGGCTDSAIRNIEVYDASLTKVTYLPIDGCKPLTVDLKTSNPKKMKYVWDFGDGTIITGADTVTRHVYNFFGDFVPKVIMKDAEGCVVPIVGKDTIRILGATAKFGVNSFLFCDSTTVQFLDSTTSNNRIVSYHWNFGDGTSSSQMAGLSHHYPKPGIYNVSLNIRTVNNCVDTFRLNFPVKVVASPVIGIVGDSVICAGEGLAHFGIFKRADTSAVQWSWTFPNGRSSSAQMPPKQVYDKAGNFMVQTIATNSSGCTDTASQGILVNPLPAVTLPSTITTTVGTPVLIPAVYSGAMRNYRWSVPDGLNCATCPQPMASPKFNTKYKVNFTDPNGCQNTGEVQVILLCNNENVFLPNTFSPNGDGSNDVFYIRGKGLSRVKSLRIFNRWGQVVFERVNFNVNDASLGWDGTFKGARPVADVYVYQVEIFCDNSQVVKFEGNLALIQ